MSKSSKAPTSSKSPKSSKSAKSTKSKANGTKTHEWKDLPAAAKQKEVVGRRARGLRRIACLTLLGRPAGASAKEITLVPGVNELHDMLRKLHREFGWGIQKLPNGNFRLVNKSGKFVAYEAPADVSETEAKSATKKSATKEAK